MNFFKNLFKSQNDKDMADVSSKIVQIKHGVMLSESPDYSKAIKDLEILRVKYSPEKHPEIYSGINAEIKKFSDTFNAIEEEQDKKTTIVAVWKWENHIENLTGEAEALEDELADIEENSEEYAEKEARLDELDAELDSAKNSLASAKEILKRPELAPSGRTEAIDTQFAEAVLRQLKRNEQKRKLEAGSEAAKADLFTELQYMLNKDTAIESLGVSLGSIRLPDGKRPDPKRAERKAKRRDNINKKRAERSDMENDEIRAKIDTIDSKMKNQES